MHVILSKFTRQTFTVIAGVMTMSEDSVEMVMSWVIPGCWSVCWASRLAADWLFGMLTPLDFMRMSEMSMVMIKSDDEKKAWSVKCQKSLTVRYAAEQQCM